MRLEYVPRVTRLASLGGRYGFDVLILIAALESALEVAFRHDAAHAPTMTRWLAVPAVALVVLPLLARRRFPFAAPAAVWLLAAALSFADGRLVVFTAAPFIAGMAAAFLLGNLRDDNAGRAWVWRSCSAGPRIVVYERPGARARRARLHSAPVRDRMARGLRAARARRAGGSRGAARDPGRARAGGDCAHRRRRGAGADRARAPRHRRPRRQRDGAAGRRRPAQAPRGARARTATRSRASSRPAARRSPRCAACSARCAARARTPSARPSRASTASTR